MSKNTCTAAIYIYYRVEIYIYRSGYVFRSPYRRSPVGGEPFLHRVVRTLESIPKHLGNSSWGCSRYDCSCSSSPNRRRVFLLPRNLARRLSSRVRLPIRTKDHIPLPEAKFYPSIVPRDFTKCFIRFGKSLSRVKHLYLDKRREVKRTYPRNIRIVYVPFLMRMLLLLVAGDSRWHRRRSHATPAKKSRFMFRYVLHFFSNF